MLKNRSSAQSYFFKLLPNYLKADYAFAKNIKPNTSYRLVLFKGIIKTDEMNHQIKVKLVGGKISFDNNVLSFYLPIFSPLKNIEFTIKIMSAVGTEDETQIAFHKLKSGDYIKHFRAEGTQHFNQQVQLLDSFSFAYDLFIHHSKAQLQEIVKFHRQKTTNYPCNTLEQRVKTYSKIQTVSEYFSQYEESQNGSIYRENSISSVKKKLTRKRGHDGALKKGENIRNREIYSQKQLQTQQKRKYMHLMDKDNQLFFLPQKHAQTHKRSQSDRYMIKPFKFQEEELAHTKKESLSHQRSTPKFKDFLESKENIMKSIKIETIDTLYKQGEEETFKNFDSLETFKKQSINQNQNHQQTFSKELYLKRPNLWHNQSFGKHTTLKTETLNSFNIYKQDNNSKQIRRQHNTYHKNISFEQRQLETDTIKDQKDSVQIAKGKRLMKKIFSFSEVPLKLSYGSPSVYDQNQDQAPRQFESIKMRILYIGFWIISIILFFNALLPSRKR